MDARAGAAVEVRFEYSAAGSLLGRHEGSCLAECVEIVTRAALEPDRTALVVTGDFVRSVRDRFPIGVRHLYTSERGDGEVGAKVMKVDEEIHVLVPEYYFEPQTDPSFDYDLRNRHVTRLMRHEAGHVTMEQAGEASGPTIDRDGAARRRLLHIADEVISEYRAELDVSLDYRTAIDGFRPGEVASWLRSTLAYITTVSYQEHLEPERLAYDVAGALQIAAKQLAPNAAARRLRAVSPQDKLDAATASDPDWRAMVGPIWTGFAGALVAVPPASERLSRRDLDAATAHLADVLHEWLLRLNFDWDDHSQSFRILSFELYAGRA